MAELSFKGVVSSIAVGRLFSSIMAASSHPDRPRAGEITSGYWERVACLRHHG